MKKNSEKIITNQGSQRYWQQLKKTKKKFQRQQKSTHQTVDTISFCHFVTVGRAVAFASVGRDSDRKRRRRLADNRAERHQHNTEHIDYIQPWLVRPDSHRVLAEQRLQRPQAYHRHLRPFEQSENRNIT